MCIVCGQQCEERLQGFGGKRCVMEATRYQVCQGAETRFYLGYLGRVGFDEGGVGGEPLGRELEVCGW